MIKCSEMYNHLNSFGINFFAGVPDSLLKDFCAYITDNAAQNHVITANEGNAVALAAGQYLATGKMPVVYMQNSGIGNAINPLASLTSKDVYSIPMLLVIGWRGEPGKKDEPQHKMQGRLTVPMMETMEIPYSVLPQNEEEMKKCINLAVDTMKTNSAPYAILIQDGTFEKYSLKTKKPSISTLEREEAIKSVTATLTTGQDIVLSTTGKISRELYEYRVKNEQASCDFLNVGSMGHVSHIALGVAMARPDKQIYCYDGDGATLMHMGGLGIIGSVKPQNFKHIIFNNGAHDSVGGQPTIGFEVDFISIAKGCGYSKCFKVDSLESLKQILPEFKKASGPALLEIVVKKGARDDLGRPKSTPQENKQTFMAALNA